MDLITRPELLPDAPGATTCERLLRERDRIVRRWTELARRSIYPAREQLDPTLIDSMPVVIGRLADALRDRTSISRPVEDEIVLARVHGTQRALIDEYQLQNILSEYALMRKAIFEVLEEDGTIEIWERERILDILQEIIEAAAGAFFMERAHQSRVLRDHLKRIQYVARSKYRFLIAGLASVLGVSGFAIGAKAYGLQLYFLPLSTAIVTSLFLGFGAGCLSVIASGLAVAYLFLEPIGSPLISRPADQFGTALFLTLGTAVTFLAGWQRRKYIDGKATEAHLKSMREKEEEIGASKESHILTLELERDLRERFVAALTHDLRNPLSAAKAAAQMIKRVPDDFEKVMGLSQKIDDSLTRANTMIEDLLDASMIRGGHGIRIELAPCDLSRVIDGIVSELRTVHGERFVVECDTGLNGIWSCSALGRVIENLAVNGIKYGTPGRPVTIRAKAHGERVRLSVHNEGRTLEEAELKRLFEHFHRGADARKSGHRGWGIGLTLVEGIVEAHHGTVDLLSAPGEGTTFVIDLPRDAGATP